ncbi:class I SAM-dependent methyltransferase [Chloroflexota bacterium]
MWERLWYKARGSAGMMYLNPVIKALIPKEILVRIRPRDITGYEVLIDFMIQRGLQAIDGHIVDIGAFLGGGTAKLARFGKTCNKKVYAIDVFNIDCDKTICPDGTLIAQRYHHLLDTWGSGKSQMDIFKDSIKGCNNVIVLSEDSKAVTFPADEKLVFAFIDGNHSPDYVTNDFYLVWNRLAPGGAAAFDDYGENGLPEVTSSVDSLITEHQAEISDIVRISPQGLPAHKTIIILVKK